MREERILPVGPLVVPKHRIQIFPMEFERIVGDRFTDSFVDAGPSRAAACSPFARRALSRAPLSFAAQFVILGMLLLKKSLSPVVACLL